MRTLVTGCSGFTGRYLVRMLRERFPGVNITGIDISEPASDGVDVFKKCDMANESARDATGLAGYDWIFHLAGRFGAGDDGLEPIVASLAATENLLWMIRRMNTRPVVLMISSSAVYGRQVNANMPVTENALVRPATSYGIGKLISESLSYKAFIESGTDVRIARTFNLIGKGISPQLFIGKVLSRIAQGRDGADVRLELGYCGNIRDYVDIRDTIEAYVRIVQFGSPGEIYNVGSGRGCVIRDLLQLMAHASEKHFQWTEQKEPLPNDIPGIVADVSKLRSLGWSPNYNIQESVKALFE